MLEMAHTQFTTTVATGTSPRWDQEFRAPRVHEGSLELKLFSKGLFSSKVKGRGLLLLKRVLIDRWEQRNYKLFHSNRVVGEVLICLHFEADPLRKSTAPPKQLPPVMGLTRCLSEVPLPKEESPQRFHSAECSSSLIQGLTPRDVFFEQQIYRNANGKQVIYNAKILPSNIAAAVKISYCSTQAEYNEVQKEGATMCMISHPNICKIYANLFDTTHGTLNNLIVMEKIEGGDLSVHIQRHAVQGRPWPENELTRHFYALLSAFAELETRGIAHSDIKPQNIVLAPSGDMKVIDFGISLVDAREFFITAKTLQVGGTIPYFSPLQLTAYIGFVSGRNPSAKVKHNPCKSDVFALGLTFYHMASLKVPERLNDYDERLQDRINVAVEGLPYNAGIQDTIKRMLTVDEKQRPTFTQLINELASK